MLKYLHIENIAVIEKSEIELTDGFNVLTGETGAGKSIIIDSINAVLGERASKDLIRAGCDKAEVSALFCNLQSSALETLRDNGFAPDEEGNLLIRRTLSLSGSSTVKINGKPATAGLLCEIGKTLVNIHGQHDNQSLLDPSNHCGYIDRMAENADLLGEYYAEFKHLNAIRRELEALETDEEEKQRKIELLQYQINELESASITVGEQEKLRENLSVAQSYEKTLKLLNEVNYYISGSDDENGAITLLEGANKNLLAINGEQFGEDAQKVSDTLCLLEEVSDHVRRFCEDTEFAELDLEKIQDRLDLLHRLMLKYGNSEEAMLSFLEDARKQLKDINFSEQRTLELSDALDQSTERLVALGDKLTASRVAAGKEFSKNVCEVLTYLDMPAVQFTVNITKGRYTKNGCDAVEFLISANAGESVKPLAKIASGGELSRVMLSIKSVLAGRDDVDTLIFDEIDTGISGHAASKVGVQLKKVSGNRQVLCVTHLAQIAAFADTHLLIRKRTENGRAYTGVEPLCEKERIHEIGRIMSGGTLTENLYNSAKELLDRSRDNENL